MVKRDLTRYMYKTTKEFFLSNQMCLELHSVYDVAMIAFPFYPSSLTLSCTFFSPHLTLICTVTAHSHENNNYPYHHEYTVYTVSVSVSVFLSDRLCPVTEIFEDI